MKYNKKIDWWVRICLWFVLPEVSYDIGNGKDKNRLIYYKCFRNRIYIIGYGNWKS